MPSSFANIDNYTLYRYDNKKSPNSGRKRYKVSGGSCIYVKSIYKCKQIKEMEECDGIEAVWLKLQFKFNKSFIIGSLYRHPNAPKTSLLSIEKNLRAICEQKCPSYILGDFNIDILKKIANSLKYSRDLHSHN